MAMEMEDLKTTWSELCRRMDTCIDWNQKIWKEQKLEKTRSALRRLAVRPIFDLTVDFLLVFLAGSYLADNLGMARFAAPGLLIFVCLVASLVTNIRQLAIIGQLDYSGPVVAIQQELGKLRVLRIRTTMWIFLLAPLLWIPLLIVLIHGLTGFDIYLVVSGPWLILNLAFGLSLIPLGVWLSRHFGQRLRKSRILGNLADDIAGRNLVAAQGFVNEMIRFQKEG